MARILEIKQKNLVQIRDNFTVTDENGNDVYQVTGSIIRIPKQLKILDMNGQEVAKITTKVISLLPQFYVEVGGEQVATIKKKLSVLKAKYNIEGPGISVRGNVVDMDFEISKDGQVIGMIDKKWLSLKDVYHLEINDLSHEVIMLGIVLAIDQVKRQERAGAAAANT